MHFDRHQSPGFIVNQMARLFARALHERIRPLGLAPAQFMTLLALWEEDGLTQTQLTRRLDVEQATMANTLTRMERDGLIVRRPHASDARAQGVWLTPKARALEGPATEAASEVNRKALSALSVEAQTQFAALAGAIVGALKDDDPGGAA